jgi:hypothetical protein
VLIIGFPGVQALDLVGPFAVFTGRWWPGALLIAFADRVDEIAGRRRVDEIAGRHRVVHRDQRRWRGLPRRDAAVAAEFHNHPEERLDLT